MQEYAKDWHREVLERGEDLEEESGCCLLCASAEEGCLCLECKCKRCYWYHREVLDKNYCELAEQFKEKRKAKEEYYKQQAKKYGPRKYKLPQTDLNGGHLIEEIK